MLAIGTCSGLGTGFIEEDAKDSDCLRYGGVCINVAQY
jgi:hypothetical protein